MAAIRPIKAVTGVDDTFKQEAVGTGFHSDFTWEWCPEEECAPALFID